MKIDDLQTLVEQRRSIRGYDEKRDVTDEMIRAILNCARWAPSGGNGQPWEFIIVHDQATRYQIADYYMKQMEQKREMDMAVRGTAKMTGDGFRRAPVHIVILGDPRVKESYPIRTKLEKAESHFITGLANATLLIHLAATSLGLASQYVSDANSPYMETMLKVLLKIPEPLRIYHLVPIGYAKGPVAAPPRRTLDEIVHYETYDINKYRNDDQLSGFVKTRTLQGAYGRKDGAEGDEKNLRRFARAKSVLSPSASLRINSAEGTPSDSESKSEIRISKSERSEGRGSGVEGKIHRPLSLDTLSAL